MPNIIRYSEITYDLGEIAKLVDTFKSKHGIMPVLVKFYANFRTMKLVFVSSYSSVVLVLTSRLADIVQKYWTFPIKGFE